MAYRSVNYTSSDGDVGATGISCAEENTVPPGVTCEHGMIQFGPTKIGGPERTIRTARNSDSTYEIISGGTEKPNPHLLRVFAINQVNCKKHKDKVVSIFVKDATPILNSKNDNEVALHYPYSYKISQIWNLPPVKSELSINTCMYGAEKIHVILYPDAKWSFEFKIDGTISSEPSTKVSGNGSAKERVSLKISGSLGLEANSGSDKAEAELTYEDAIGMDGKRPKDLDDRLTFQFSSGGRLKVNNPLRTLLTYKDLSKNDFKGPIGKLSDSFDLIRMVYACAISFQEKVDKVLQDKEKKKPKTSKLSWAITKGASYSWNSFYETKEGLNGLPEVWKCSEIELEGKLFEVEWHWDLTEFILTKFGLTGKIVNYLNEMAKGKDLGGLTIKIGASGALKVGLMNRKTYTRSGEANRVVESQSKLECDINILLEIKAEIRVDPVTKYTSDGKVSMGCTYEFSPSKFYNNEWVIQFVVFKEVCGGQIETLGLTSNIPKECEADKVEYLNTEFKIFEEKALFGA